MTLERSLVLIKPDGMQRNLAFEILRRIETRGYRVIGLKLMRMTPEIAAQHYAEHVGKGFYEGLVSYMTAGPIVAAVFEGPNVVAAIRSTIGKTDPVEAAPGTVRGDLGVSKGRNLIHASDSPESGTRETNIFFRPEELIPDWSRNLEEWLVSSN